MRIPAASGLSLVVFAARFAVAAPGDLDPTFGTGGIAAATSLSIAHALVLQADGKPVMVGSLGADFYVARFAADGTMDASFGSGGVVTTPTAMSGEARAVVQQPDGKLVVAGATYTGTDYDLTLVRYEVDGTLDATFGTGGLVTTAGPVYEVPQQLLLQPDGKIVVAGFTRNVDVDVWRFMLARYDVDGNLDPTFGTGGFVTEPEGVAETVVRQPDGKLVAAGWSHNATDEDVALARYDTDGTLDPAFGTGGHVSTPIGASSDLAFGLVRESDGTFAVAAYTYTGSGGNLVLLRYDAGGVFDAGFGTGGFSEPVPGALGFLGASYGFVEQPDGKLVAALGTANPSPSVATLARWTPGGTLDATFGAGGIVTTSIGSGNDDARGLVIQADGRFVVLGESELAPYYGALLRYESGLCCTGGPCTMCAVCEACGASGCEPAPAGDACPDDGNSCTDDTCDGAAVCTHTPAPAGTACANDGNLCTNEACDGASTCVHTAEPAAVCDVPTLANGASLRIRSTVVPGKDQVRFKWAKGPAIPDLTSLDMRLCVYDASGGAYTSVYEGSPSVQGGGLWTFSGPVWRFKNKSGQPDGITDVRVKRSPLALAAKIQVKAKGDLVLAPLPLAVSPAVVAQLRTDAGQCWGGVFPLAKRNDAQQFSAKSE